MSIEFYEEYIESNKSIIYKICRAYSHSQEEFEDYFQEVCLQLWRSKESYQQQSKLSTWVYRVSLNTCLSMVKKETKKVSTVEINEKIDQVHQFSEKEERLEELYRAIRMLKEVDRAIILLYLEEHSYQDIASIMGISSTNVGAKINRIKKQLKENMLWKSLT
ncbi:RNA polymerase sigma factor [Flammeovirga aprica]|uniref:Sigma-70 family RNA polymerase sigma factor n=1 Tax=Flammeovirga aprica JL-4 TaxID=694437 RepID=A0A7X9RTW5_9BACT|nr:sigma-70 family RNA polymerase sigma factor [Flammeovirga aprica]NME67922.1 sigma-70 family RNA polymerase sigma factor [Flammeovirga aprica JL-4]